MPGSSVLKRGILAGWVLILLPMCLIYGQEPNTVELSGIIYYNNIPMSGITDVEPHFGCNDADTGQHSIPITTLYDSNTAAYSINGLPPHNLVLFFDYHLIGPTWTFPGNYRQLIVVDVNALSEWERSHFDIDVKYIIHMTCPWDNNGIDFYTYPGDPHPVHPNDLLFEWEEVEGAEYYGFWIVKYRDPDHPDGPGFIEWIEDSTVTENFFWILLDESAEQEHYRSMIHAYNAQDDRIGYQMITYKNGYSSDYRFKARICPTGNIDWYCPVDFLDLAILANWWRESNCGMHGDCGGADLDLSGTVDEWDADILFDGWLLGI